MDSNKIILTTDDSAEIVLWKCSSEKSPGHKHIFLTHGTFSNRKVLLGIMEFLVEQGYTCWIMEWRGHGDSPKPSERYNFETIGLYDVPAEEYIAKRGKAINCLRMSDFSTAFEAAGIGAQFVPSRVVSAPYPGKLHSWWQDKYSAQDLATQLCLIAGPPSA